MTHVDPLLILLAGVIVVVGSVLLLRMHAFLALTLGAVTVGALTSTDQLERYAATQVANDKMWQKEAEGFAKSNVAERVAAGFGNTCAGIGIVIAMASIIGKCLLDSGAADRIVRSALKVVGVNQAPLAFVGSGFLLGIPVFFDTVFYLMIPLGKALRMRTGKNYLLYVLSIVAGATMAHSLVPPTPGPLYVAGELDVDLGLMILAGCAVGLFTSSSAYLYARWINGWKEIPLRESPDISLAELEALTRREESELPPLLLSLLPIVLPVILIGGDAALDFATKGKELPNAVLRLMAISSTLGNKNVALIISAAIALVTYVWKRHASRDETAKAVQAALASGGLIILITAAGGAFGKVLQQTGIAERIEELAPESSGALIVLAFLVTTMIRTAQGSATVAMITAAGIMASMVNGADLGFHPVYIALAIGCGSKPVAWMNDSGFWVICKMSGMTEAETLSTLTPMSILMGVVGLLVTLAGAHLFPLV